MQVSSQYCLKSVNLTQLEDRFSFSTGVLHELRYAIFMTFCPNLQYHIQLLDCQLHSPSFDALCYAPLVYFSLFQKFDVVIEWPRSPKLLCFAGAKKLNRNISLESFNSLSLLYSYLDEENGLREMLTLLGTEGGRWGKV